MNIWIYLILIVFIGQLNTILSKKFQQSLTMDNFHFVVYTMIFSAFACINFFIIAGFCIAMNLKTFLFASGYALIVVFSMVFQMFLYSNLTVSLVSILSSSGNIIISSLFGLFILSEPPSFALFVSIFLMILGITLPFFNSENVGVSKKTHLLLCIIQFVMAGVTTIYSKLFANATDVTDTNSYFFMTNFILFIISLIAVIIYRLHYKLSSFNIFNGRQITNIVLRTFFSNLSSIISIIIIKNMPISIYTIITSSCGLIGAGMLSHFYFKEPMPLFDKLALLCAVLAILIAPN